MLLALAGCSSSSSGDGLVLELAGVEGEFSEAPQLADGPGDLPAVTDRLPIAPLEVAPHDEPGRYGGTMRLVGLDDGDRHLITRHMGYEKLVRWDPAGEMILPNLAERIEVNSDADEYRFFLRTGLKWSDGAPFTSADIAFAFTDVMMNPDLSPDGPPGEITTESGSPELDVVSDTEFVFRFAEPNGLFLQNLAHPVDLSLSTYPRHYLEPLHTTYAPDADSEARAAGFDSWVERFANASEPQEWRDPDMPTMTPWTTLDPYPGTKGLIRAVRNPYFWKVDTDGRQLPYVDALRIRLVKEPGQVVAAAIAGEIDVQDRHLIGPEASKARLIERAPELGLSTYALSRSPANQTAISLNLTVQDPVLREVFQNKDFRIGLSHGLNRQRIIDEVYGGKGRPTQVAPPESTPFYDPELESQYTDFDPALAVEALDRAGYPADGTDGARIGPDGQPIAFTFDVASEFVPEWKEVAERAAEDWGALGVSVEVRGTSRDSYEDRLEANALEASMWGGNGGTDALLENRYFLPSSRRSEYAVGWAVWLEDPADPVAVEPPDIVKDQYAILEDLRASANPEEQNALMRDILQVAEEQFYVMGIAPPTPASGIVSQRMRNVPDAMPLGFLYPTPAPTNPEQYFIAAP